MKKILLSSVCFAMLAVSANAAHHARVSLGATMIDDKDVSYFYNLGIDVKKYKESQEENPLVYGVEMTIEGRTFDIVNYYGTKVNEVTFYQFDLGALGGYGLYLPLGGADLSLDLLGGIGLSTIGVSYDTENVWYKNASESLFYVKAGASAVVNLGKKDNGVSLLAEGFIKHTFDNDNIKLDRKSVLELKGGAFYNIKKAFAGVEVGTKDVMWSDKGMNPYVTFTAGYRF